MLFGPAAGAIKLKFKPADKGAIGKIETGAAILD
jgi:hypothetical protein